MAATEDTQGKLFSSPIVAAKTVIINDRCLIRAEDRYRIVVISGIVLAQYADDDAIARAYAMVSLIEQGWATQKEVARAFGVSSRSVRRYQRRLADGGLTALWGVLEDILWDDAVLRILAKSCSGV